MRTSARETVPQLALRIGPKEAVGERQHICDFGERGIHASEYIFFRKVFANLVTLC